MREAETAQGELTESQFVTRAIVLGVVPGLRAPAQIQTHLLL